MTYVNALKKIHSFPRTSGAPTLERMRLLCKYLGEPQKRLKFVHIAGTNGKGSSAAMLDSVLRSAGYRTGRYISPYILDFRERMTVDGEMISHAELCEHTEAVLSAVRKMQNDIEEAKSGELVSHNIPKVLLDGSFSSTPVQFEIVTAIGFLYFAAHRCDAVVLECGLGGRFDATNVIDPPMVALIMSIGLDHTELLGDTEEKIAAEKCGIIKRGTTEVISYPQSPDVMRVISESCINSGCRISVPQRSEIRLNKASLGGLDFSYKGKDYKTALAASYQLLNASTVIETVEALNRVGMDISYEALKSGLARTVFPARFEVLGASPAVIVDGAHNESGISALCDSLSIVSRYLSGRIVFFVGMLTDKAPEKALAPFVSFLGTQSADLCSIVTLTPDNPRAMDADELKNLLTDMTGGRIKIKSCDTTEKKKLSHLRPFLEDVGEEDAVVSFGSLYLAAEMRVLLSDFLDSYK
ncbi:MAG: bifunctional folylpolyglutamate synthase/dihydrofolate synthase [Ruminococcaceae bacterium]|nr:bifunctional folylpolyglutamate synthase/dihydrofolate synthase [Oscillospiraceae bacterium]